jgi:indolepyruvate ferredoxin oxidoreductase
MVSPRTDVTLDDKYTAHSGRVLISGVQAIVRLLLEQRRIDEARGLRTAAFVSGYPGSPLGGLDQELQRNEALLLDRGVVFRPGLNEELAATAVGGSQLVATLPKATVDGVASFWFGKNPGLDRAADAIRHANVVGTAALGGSVAVIGDDPGSKSSTIPSSCELLCESLSMPLLAPGTVAEVVEFGLHAVALSRATGLWSGLKIIADVADASATIDVSGFGAGIGTPPAPRRQTPLLLAETALDAEHDMLTARLDAARRYGVEQGLNKIVFDAPQSRLGIVASGTAFAAVERALADLCLEEADLARLGVRLIRLGMPFPLDEASVRDITSGLAEVLVVEDKTPFIEGHLKSALYGRPGAPLVLGRFDTEGNVLLPARGMLDADTVARAVGERVGRPALPPAARARVELLASRPRRRTSLPLAAPRRSPYFCSGCPHNTSTRAGDDTLVGVGIGCHVMVMLEPAGRGRQAGMTQMGGEGAQWIGMRPFTTDDHFVQNLGDGTFHHSGSLAIRAAVAAGVTMTYKLLYNDAVAMTGGQTAPGRMDVPAIVRLLAVEGVRKIVITTPEPRTYKRVQLHPVASVRHRDDFDEVVAELAKVEGVTVVIHDDRCAAEERRLRKRRRLPSPTERVMINERVCEGCGDCGQKSTCLSVQPVETEYGAKTRIHQASCNVDLSCLKGDCPSFLLVRPTGKQRKREVPEPPTGLPEPVRRVVADETLLRMPGIGGTGVVTVSQILQMAAHLEGRYAAGLEQTGLAQKGGPVISDVRIAKHPIGGSLKATRASADVVLGFDVLGAAEAKTTSVADPAKTIAVVNTALVPTAQMVTHQAVGTSSVGELRAAIDAVTRAGDNLFIDALGLAQSLFDDHMPANMLLVGAAYQHGVIPVGAEAIEAAIRLNGAAANVNVAAFRWGRAAVADPQRVAAVTMPASQRTPNPPVDLAIRQVVASSAVPKGVHDVVAARATDLIAFQDRRLALRYIDDVAALAQRAAGSVDTETLVRLVDSYARNLYKLTAYKDEYEVARLHLDEVERSRVADEFGADAAVAVMLHPPALRALGMKRKIALRRIARPTFRTLHAARRLRGTRWDPFGRAQVRRVERELIAWYKHLAQAAIDQVSPATLETVAAVLALPDEIRGYEEIKLAGVRQARAKAAELMDRLPAARLAAAAERST